MMAKEFNPWYDEKTNAPSVHRNYDVRVTLNKNGSDRYVCRFGFLNKAAETFAGAPFIEISSVKKSPTRIYFRTATEKKGRSVHKLLTNNRSASKNLYTSITPGPGEEKLYRMSWVNGTYDLKYDEANGVYYIENERRES